MRYTVKFFDNLFSGNPAAIEAFTADTYAAALEKAALRVEELRQKLNDRIGYVIVENETGRVVTTVAGRH